MNTEPIVFHLGEENGIVVERKEFKHSIMLNQYQQAVDIFHRLWKHQEEQIKDIEKHPEGQNDIWVDNKLSNIIAFCGDRGEGKSSCMASFATMLTDKDARSEAQEEMEFPKGNKGNGEMLAPDKIEWLDVIDPSFFDKDHNLLEILLGRICAKAQQKTNKDAENDCTILSKQRILMEQLEVVKRCITTMTPKSDKLIYDNIESISELASGLQLKTELQKLFKCYLNFVEKECLLICIDDLDLNFSQGYKMAEMLRKYLINPYCIILVSVKVEQLIDIIATEHKRTVNGSGITWDDCQQMAQKYVTKLLPRGNRVVMPSIDDICERRIKLADTYNEKDKDFENITVKERTVQLIFQKTGYVFYNGLHLSPIVPRNLRELRHLISALEELPDYRDKNGDNETGREIFKDYFINTWSKRLTDDDYRFARQLFQYIDLSTFNAFVVEYVAKRLKDAKIDIVAKENLSGSNKGRSIGFITDNEEDDIDEIELQKDCVELYTDITNRTNTSTNISLGDVMYVLWLISTITVDEDLQNLIFFVRTVYSMRLYACYNEISASEGALYPHNSDIQRINIHKADSLYDHVNCLQRLVNGSYFSYPQGMLLSNKQDRMPIDFKGVQKLVQAVDKELLKDEEDRSDYFVPAFQLCEYLAMCLVRTTTNQEKEEDKGYNRIAQIPQHFGALSKTASVAIFDFLAPFYSACNIKYAYRRFDEIMQRGTSLYELASDNEDSLLYQMIHSVRNGEYDDFEIHGFISDAIIRVIDVQGAIFDELLRQKRRRRKGSMLEKIRAAYSYIQKLNIKLYPRLNVSDNKIEEALSIPTIRFEFLAILSQALIGDFKDIEGAIDHYTFYLKKSPQNDIDQHIIDPIITAIENVPTWPLQGNQIKQLIKESISLKSSQSSSFSARLGKIIHSKSQYTKEDVLALSQRIKEIYIIAKSK